MLVALEGLQSRVPDDSVEATILSLLLAFVLGQATAWLYSWTHAGLSYSRAFTQSLLLMTMVVTLVMFVIGNSIITAFGLLGALAIVRFRNVLKDTRDTVFVFFTLVLGVAIGSERHLTALLGTGAFVLVVLYLHVTSFGSHGRFDGHLSLRLRLESREKLQALLHRFCRSVKQVSQRRTGSEDPSELLFQIRLRDRNRSHDMLCELEKLTGVFDPSLVLRDELLEI